MTTKKLNLADLNLSLNNFGSAPIRREGSAVNYESEIVEVGDAYDFEIDVELDGEKIHDSDND
jgi:hypothetical protein